MYCQVREPEESASENTLNEQKDYKMPYLRKEVEEHKQVELATPDENHTVSKLNYCICRCSL